MNNLWILVKIIRFDIDLRRSARRMLAYFVRIWHMCVEDITTFTSKKGAQHLSILHAYDFNKIQRLYDC